MTFLKMIKDKLKAAYEQHAAATHEIDVSYFSGVIDTLTQIGDAYERTANI